MDAGPGAERVTRPDDTSHIDPCRSPRHRCRRPRAVGDTQHYGATAQALGHEIGHRLRNDQENIRFSTRCDARLYVRLGANPACDDEGICQPYPGALPAA